MKYKKPLRQILESTQRVWDNDQIRPTVRNNFRKVMQCGTEALGAEIFASETESRLVYHTCKSRACPSCGHMATERWQRDQWHSLPDIPFADVCLTMPDVLWPVFKRNRHLLHDLPALGAAAVQQFAKAHYGVTIMVMVVPHTFGRRLNFNSHLHLLVSSGGVRVGTNEWLSPIDFDKTQIERIWRYAVVSYLYEANRTGVLASDMPISDVAQELQHQHGRHWNIHISRFKSKAYFLRYAGRYVRRPPIAQHRFETINDSEVKFWRKDLREKKRVLTAYSPEEFVTALGHHIHDHYRHGIRYFGLLAPGSKHASESAAFLMLGQSKRTRPRRLGWAQSLNATFGVDPLRDSKGQIMKRIGRRKPLGELAG
jgi:hypothetical protein